MGVRARATCRYRAASCSGETVRGSRTSRPSWMRAITAGSPARSQAAIASGAAASKATRCVGNVSPGKLPPPTVDWPGRTRAGTPAACKRRTQAIARSSSADASWLIICHTGTCSGASPNR